MSRFDPTIGLRRDEVGALIDDVNARFDSKDEETAQIVASTVTGPILDITFTPIFSVGKKKKKFRITLRFADFGSAKDIRTTFLNRDEVLTEDDFNQKRLHGNLTDEIPDAAIAAQSVTMQVDQDLDPDTPYDIIKIASLSEDGKDKAVNPSTPLAYADYPAQALFSFTTPSFFETTASPPELGLIIQNELYEATQAFDAQIAVVTYAPVSGSTVAYSGTVAKVGGSTSLTGSVSFVGQVAIGQKIVVANEHRLVTNVVTTTITVDYPWKNSGSGLSMTIATLQTWGEALVDKISHRFILNNDPDAHSFGIPHEISEAEKLLTVVTSRRNEFVAAEQYKWLFNRLIGGIGEGVEATPPSDVIFVAGDSIGDLSLITGFEFIYDVVNGESRDVSCVWIEPSPPIGKDELRFYRRNTGDGTVSISGTTVSGTSTEFTADFQKKDQIISAGQTFDVVSVTDDDTMTVSPAASPSISSQPYTISKFKEKENLRKRKYHPPSGGAVPVIPLRQISTKKLENYDFVAVIVAANGTTREFTDSFTAGSTGSIETDTAVPTLATNAETSNTGPTVQDWFGSIKVIAVTPSANIATLKNFEFVMSTSSSAPAGTPSVGSEGVVRKREGPSASHTFQPKQNQFGSTFYFYFRAQNDVGFSAWSAGTSVIPSRPLQDVIGDGVPISPERLEHTGTSGTGHTSTTFVLDSGASSQDDFYNGMCLRLYGGASDTAREITDYVGSTRTLTITPAFDSTPSGALAFDVHRIEVDGDRCGRSGTGHTSTTFVLESAASAVDDFYNGYTILVPSLASGKIRKVTAYVGATRTCTAESAFGSTPSGNQGYILVNGSFGWQNTDESGIISPAPFRHWLNGDTDRDIIEVLLPIGGNAFSLSDFQVNGHQANAGGDLRINDIVAITSGVNYDFEAPDGTTGKVFRVRFRNKYRESGSDGWSAWSSYVKVEFASSAPSPGTPNYEPDVYEPVIIDYQGPASYPDTRYPTF